MPRYQRTFRAMGSPFLICIDTAVESAYVEQLFDKVERRTEQLEQVMSRFRPDSELVLLNRRVGETVHVSTTLQEVLLLAQTFMQVGGGAFDPRVLPGLEHIGYHGAPLESAVAQNPPSGGGRQELFTKTSNHGSICLHHPIDLGGIGKGFTSDALADLIEASIDADMLFGYLVDAGGDIVISGMQENGDGWSIGIEDPYGKADELTAAVQIPPLSERLAMCTSSLKRRSWVHDGIKVHHLLDPVSKTPVNTRLRAVTALGPTAAYTEVFTKCKMISTVSDGNHSYTWQGVPLPYLEVDVERVLAYTKDFAPVITWISSNYQDVKVLS